MTRGRTRRWVLGAGAACAVLGTPAHVLAQRGAIQDQGRLGWDDLEAHLGKDVRIAGFLHALPSIAQGPKTALLLPCHPGDGLPPSQRIVVVALPGPLLSDPNGDLIVEIQGRIASSDGRFSLSPRDLRRIWRL